MSKIIKERIDALNQEIEQLMDPTTFVLNPRIQEIDKEIRALQAECKHNFVNGICEFCCRGECNE
jgi:prefoldin subunit 5